MRSYLYILKLVWPLAIGMVNNALLQFADRAFLAHESMTSLEAILPASMLTMIALGFFQSVVAYSGTFVAQYHGAGDERGCVFSYHAGVWISIFSGLMMVALVPVGALIFESFSAGTEVIARQCTYYNICTVGGVFLFGQMAAQSYFTGRGHTKIVLWVNIVGNLLNILLDWIMIFGRLGCPKLGIAGAAYATVASMFVQWAILAAAAHCDIASFHMRYRLDRETLNLIKRILRFGVPSGGYSILNVLSFTIFVFVTARVGHLEAAVSNACFTICYLLFAPMKGFALGAQTLVGQLQGAGDSREAAIAGRKTLVLGVAFVMLASLMVVFFHRPILSLFVAADSVDVERFHELGFTLCVLMSFWQVFDAADVILSGALKGSGDTKFVFWWIFLTAFVFWLPMVFVVAAIHNTMPALWATNLIYIVVICTGTFWRWQCGHWRSIRMIAAK